jgi:hypothetical protein
VYCAAALEHQAYGDFHALPGHQLHAAHDVLLHLDQLRQLLGEVRSECAGRLVTEGVAWAKKLMLAFSCDGKYWTVKRRER